MLDFEAKCKLIDNPDNSFEALKQFIKKPVDWVLSERDLEVQYKIYLRFRDNIEICDLVYYNLLEGLEHCQNCSKNNGSCSDCLSFYDLYLKSNKSKHTIDLRLAQKPYLPASIQNYLLSKNNNIKIELIRNITLDSSNLKELSADEDENIAKEAVYMAYKRKIPTHKWIEYKINHQINNRNTSEKTLIDILNLEYNHEISYSKLLEHPNVSPNLLKQAIQNIDVDNIENDNKTYEILFYISKHPFATPEILETINKINGISEEVMIHLIRHPLSSKEILIDLSKNEYKKISDAAFHRLNELNNQEKDRTIAQMQQQIEHLQQQISKLSLTSNNSEFKPISGRMIAERVIEKNSTAFANSVSNSVSRRVVEMIKLNKNTENPLLEKNNCQDCLNVE